MELTTSTIIFIALSIVFFIFIIYLFIQLKLKKRDGKTLNQELSNLSNNIKEKSTTLSEITYKLENLNKELHHLIDLEKNEKTLKENVEDSMKKLETLSKEIELLETSKSELSDNLISIKDDVSIFQPVLDLINVGFVDEPEYLFETSERFKEEIKIIRENQKALIIDKNAINIPETIALTSNNTYTNRILSAQSQLMLKAFNVECDNLMAKVRTSNYAKILERIDKLAATIEKLSISLKCGFKKEYVELKFKECELQYQYKLKDAREKEEQAIIKEQMREEQKAIREFERALAKAQKEEKMYKDALEEARKELEISSEKDREKLNEKIALLEKKLQEAEENEKRAKSMAEQTKRGHVYIISNIGSFGEDIYKIGLTRRLEPLERVKELGGASVPFSFDVHAMIYSEDAPALETKLHREFSRFRINQVKLRKEFFRVNLLDIKEKATEITGNELDFKVTALAEDYYESLKLQSQYSLT
ncbi:MAG: DUF4041 domain-containing protein [Candidatus Celaenobacter antarcticus]|nr:DUF4041 domain-containing protein [Candidatus Celaenobacter antarcticus]